MCESDIKFFNPFINVTLLTIISPFQQELYILEIHKQLLLRIKCIPSVIKSMLWKEKWGSFCYKALVIWWPIEKGLTQLHPTEIHGSSSEHFSITMERGRHLDVNTHVQCAVNSTRNASNLSESCDLVSLQKHCLLIFNGLNTFLSNVII